MKRDSRSAALQRAALWAAALTLGVFLILAIAARDARADTAPAGAEPGAGRAAPAAACTPPAEVAPSRRADAGVPPDPLAALGRGRVGVPRPGGEAPRAVPAAPPDQALVIFLQEGYRAAGCAVEQPPDWCADHPYRALVQDLSRAAAWIRPLRRR